MAKNDEEDKRRGLGLKERQLSVGDFRGLCLYLCLYLCFSLSLSLSEERH